MSRLLDEDQDELPQRERELTLSTGAILAIFLGLVLLCGVFFSFGYNLGRKATTASNAALPPATSETEPTGTDSSTFDNFKPSPSAPSSPTPAASSTPAPAASPSTAAEAAPAKTKSVAENAPAAQPAAPPVHTAPATATTTAPRTTPATSSSTPAPTRAAAPAVAPGGAFVVQIAAISPTHKDDADLLANALKNKGYAVAEHTETQDKLIHIQVGPFATKADAEAMRERLIVDGYNAIVK